MHLGVERIEESSCVGPAIEDARDGERVRRRIDVSELDAAGVRRFVRENVGTDRVSLEHRGSRTYLVVER